MQWDNYYDILGVTKNADTQEIKRAYAARIKKYSNEQYPEEFGKIREAYEVLSNPDSRREYDRTLASTDRYNDKLRLARREIDRGNYSTARAILEEMIREFPNDRTVRLELDHCLVQLGQTDQSVNNSSSPAASASAEPKKNNDSAWGWCCCIIIAIFVFYKINH